MGNGKHSPLSKKRKFSPIVWDREEKKSLVSAPPVIEDTVISVPLPPPPPLPEGFVPINRIDMKNAVEKSDLAENDAPSYANDVDHTHMEEDEDYYPARNISASRWADGNNASEDDDLDTLPDVSKEVGSSRSQKKVSTTPELGEVVMREGSEEAASRSSQSGGELDEKGSEAEKNSYMDFENASNSGSESDSEEKSGFERTPEPILPPQRSINMLQGCRSVDEFERMNKIDEGTYGVVYRAKDKKTGEVVALKKVKMEKEREGFPLTSLREINILLSLHHPSIVDVKEVVVGSSLDSIFMVMEYMEHDLKALMETMKQPFSQSEVKCLMMQLLEGVNYLHDNWVLHRDLKTSNLLLNNRGELKICDFGLSRQYGSPLKPYTHLVVTLWYRAPELLLGAKEYSTAIDMWSLGCIMAELLAKEPLFNGKTEFDQLDKIFRILGTPNEKIWPGFPKLPGVKVNFVKQPFNKLREKFPPTSFSGRPTLSEAGFDLLNKLLTYDPEKRITAEEALNHDWFREVPLPKSKSFMPTFPAQHAQDRRVRRVMKSPDPLIELRMKEQQQGETATGSLFC
ncbi:protein kinase superfamily protein isoform X2 [Wolffia australiana]